MNNKVDFFQRKLFEPNYYQRTFESDLPKENESKATESKTRRAFLIALPFLSLYRPFASALSLSMGTLRASTKMIETFDAKSVSDAAYRVMQLSLSVLAVVGTLYHFTLGLLITTGADLTHAIYSSIDALIDAKHDLAGQEGLQALSSLLYLGIMVYGSLEIVIASIIIQATLNFYQAKQEYTKGHLPETMAKLLMGSIRMYQASGQYQLLQRRNALLEKYRDLIGRIEKRREIDHLWDHPAVGKSMEGRCLENGDNVAYDFGNSFHGMGGKLVKGMNINFREESGRKILQFKINHIFRDHLEETISHLKKVRNPEMRDLLQIFGSQIKGIRIEEDKDLTGFFKEYAIHLRGLGHIRFGKSDHAHTLHTRITVDMEEGANLYDFHEALAFLGLEDALRASAEEDFERMKLGHLFHMFAPKEATLFVREDAYFDLPIDQFKNAIITKAPEMESVFDKWLDHMSFKETLPDKMRFWIDGLAKEMQSLGVRGLTTGLMGAFTKEELYSRVSSILKMGMISSESRHINGLQETGLSWGADYMTGGADSVFTQMVTDQNRSFTEFNYKSPIRIHFSPKVLNSGTYQSHYDSFGTRQINQDSWWGGWMYLNRPNLPDFINEEKNHFHSGHEVMIKDRIPPEWITGITVQNQELKDALFDDLRKRKIIELDAEGHERILGKLADQFIWVGNEIRDEMFA